MLYVPSSYYCVRLAVMSVCISQVEYNTECAHALVDLYTVCSVLVWLKID